MLELIYWILTMFRVRSELEKEPGSFSMSTLVSSHIATPKIAIAIAK